MVGFASLVSLVLDEERSLFLVTGPLKLGRSNPSRLNPEDLPGRYWTLGEARSLVRSGATNAMLLEANALGRAPFNVGVFSIALVLLLGSGGFKWVSCLAFLEADMLASKEVRQKLTLLL